MAFQIWETMKVCACYITEFRPRPFFCGFYLFIFWSLGFSPDAKTQDKLSTQKMLEDHFSTISLFYFNIQCLLNKIKVLMSESCISITYNIFLILSLFSLFIFKDYIFLSVCVCLQALLFILDVLLTEYCSHWQLLFDSELLVCNFTADDIWLLLVCGRLPVRLHSAAPQGAAGPAPPPHPAMLWLQVRAYAHTHTQTYKRKNIKHKIIPA